MKKNKWTPTHNNEYNVQKNQQAFLICLNVNVNVSLSLTYSNVFFDYKVLGNLLLQLQQ